MTPHGQTVAYKRVSTISQKTDRQLPDVVYDKLFEDKASARNIDDRPALKEMLAYVRSGDTIITHSMDRLARNVQELLQLTSRLNSQGIKVVFHKENITLTGDDSPMNKLLLTMLGAVSEFELSLINERRREGQQRAKELHGKHIGRPSALNEEHKVIIQSRIDQGVPIAKIARDLGVSRATVYRTLDR